MNRIYFKGKPRKNSRGHDGCYYKYIQVFFFFVSLRVILLTIRNVTTVPILSQTYCIATINNSLKMKINKIFQYSI